MVTACDDEVIPDGDRIEGIGDQAELEAVYESERHLFFYLACTRPVIGCSSAVCSLAQSFSAIC